ncbi:hypothetical protein LTR84_007570 [Exophiala bonariae]|uniref:Nucleoside phosphorylase domain-containing protein n=1 Tax=Exophiala bonariae TaxID=1690606 RepID=A0AAV9NKJ8_9EURO|nr:hypothetical protein LTR84_007570 [Exophiala bonariae]
MVGIGGGAPSEENDVRLGDVVVSCPTGKSGGVVHYDFGVAMQNKEFQRTGVLNTPPFSLLTAVQHLSSVHERRGHNLSESINSTFTSNHRLKQKYERPPPTTDILYVSNFVHSIANKPCLGLCDGDLGHQVPRPQRESPENEPMVHYGLIASADKLMKDATVRDQLAETEKVLCFEMEAAGLLNAFPCLVIRGICDYSDTHKNDIWQGYAAAAAAAYARELLHIIPALSQAEATPQSADSASTTGIHDALKSFVSELAE